MVDKTIDQKAIQETARLLQTIMLDSTRVAIWFEILRKPEITANELMTKINIKKTAMYYHLNLLEEKSIIEAVVDKKEKHYHILKNFFELFTTAKEVYLENQRDLDIFNLLVVNSFIQRELNRIQSMSKEDYQRKKYPVSYVGMWFCNREKLEQIKDEYKTLFNKILELDKGEGPETVAHTTLAYYWGLMDFE
ncbi:MAG TPA: winged helix-turn-helix domain-containing protein [Candidatus Bathyarchaeia archaeon]|nr:winged helix-turn-helix domain-containing protein [Candidatus Bathyarchaeia archaeon]